MAITKIPTELIDTTSHMDFLDGEKLRLGTSNDLQLYHDASNSYINDTGTGALYIKSNYLAVAGANGHQLINAEQGAAVELFHNNTRRLSTSSTGITVTGDISGTTATASGGTSTTALASTAFVQQELTTLIGGAPSTLNDLNELAAAINDDANYNSTLTTALATKLPKAGGTMTGTITVAGSSSGTVDALIITNTDTTNNGLSIGVDSSENAFFWNGSNTSMNFATNNTARMTIDSSGNSYFQGAGHTNLEVRSGSASTKAFMQTVQDTDIRIGSSTNHPVAFYANGQERLKINNSTGNINIGSSLMVGSMAAPSTYDSRANNLVVGDSGDSGITIFSGANSDARLQFAPSGSTGLDNGLIGYDNATDKMVFATGGSDRVAIDSSGNLLVGTTSTSIATTSSETGTQISDGGISIAADNPVAQFNRISSDGAIVNLRKNGSTIGSLGNDGTDLTINSQGGMLKLFLAGSRNYNFDTVRFYPQTDNARDLGASSVRFKDLFLSGQTLVTGGALSAPSYSFIGNTNTGISRPTTNAVNIVTGGQERVRFDASGNVGIGVTPNANWSSSYRAIDAFGGATFQFEANSTRQGQNFYGYPWKYKSTRTASSIAHTSGGDISFQVAPSGTADTAITWSQAMLIKNGGSVGIGITPFSWSDLMVHTATNRNISIFDNAAGATICAITDAGASTATRLAGSPLLFTGAGGSGGEHMRIDSSGTLLVGESADFNATSTTATGLAVIQDGRLTISRSGTPMFVSRLGSDGSMIDFWRQGATVGSIASLSGDILIGTGNTGLRFYDAGKAIQPRNTDGSTARGSDAISLGMSDDPFKDLHLSGTVNAVQLDITAGTDAKIYTSNSISEVGSGIFAIQSVNTAGSALKPLGFRAEDIRFATGSAERLRIDSSGKVGIGTTAPNVKLAVDGQLSTGNKRLSLGILDLNSSSSPTQFKIITNIPFASAAADFTVNIKGFRYGSNDMVDLSIGWHYYNSTFYSASVKSSGGWAPTVTLGVENSKVVIHLASPGYWPKMYVESMYSSAYTDSYAAGWSWADSAISSDSGTPTVSPAYSSNFGNNFKMLDNGNVGIDETAPLAKLHVVGGRTNGTVYNTIIAAGGVNSTDGSGARLILTGCENDPLARGTVIEGISTGTGNSHQLNFKTNNGSSTPTTRMTIGHTGNVGIGVTDPDNPLEVLGADSGIKISSAANNRPHLRFECGSDEKLRLSANAVYGAIGDSSDTNRYMIFKDGALGYGGNTGVYEKYFSGTVLGNATVSHDITHADDSSVGTILRVEAAMTHHPSYDCILDTWVSRRGSNFSHHQQFRRDTGFSGAWSVTYVSSTVTRISKSAGSYGGGGPYWIKVTWRNV